MRVSGTLIRSLCSDAIRGGEVSGEEKKLMEGGGGRGRDAGFYIGIKLYGSEHVEAVATFL